jgi:ubiquitin-protein ligase
MKALQNRKRSSNLALTDQSTSVFPSEETGLLEQTKKLRITVSAGEIRLKKDVAEFLALESEDVAIIPTDNPLVITVRYRESCDGVRLPNVFQITVQKFYPHDRPGVRCLDSGFQSAEIGDDGYVNHPNLQVNWNPICTLLDILSVIDSVRGSLYNMQVPRFQGGAFCSNNNSYDAVPLTTSQSHLYERSTAFDFNDSCLGPSACKHQSVEDSGSMQVQYSGCETPSFVGAEDVSDVFSGNYNRSMTNLSSSRHFLQSCAAKFGSNCAVTAVHPQMETKVSSFRQPLYSSSSVNRSFKVVDNMFSGTDLVHDDNYNGFD